MSIVSVETDLEALAVVLVAEFPEPPERVWELWSDPRKLERWWGPPTYPATVERFDFAPGGEVSYYMTGPEGDRHGGWWRFTAIEAPTGLSFEDGFADADGKPADAPVAAVTVELAAAGPGTRMEMRAAYPTRADLDQVVGMGMEEGLRESAGQMDAVLAR